MSKKKYIICQGLFLSLFALIMIINFIRDGYGIYPDSDSYITFHPTFGIHHDNQLNATNLADDFIEPYRAIVDIA